MQQLKRRLILTNTFLNRPNCVPYASIPTRSGVSSTPMNATYHITEPRPSGSATELERHWLTRRPDRLLTRAALFPARFGARNFSPQQCPNTPRQQHFRSPTELRPRRNVRGKSGRGLEDCRSPRRSALNGGRAKFRQVLDCARPLALWNGTGRWRCAMQISAMNNFITFAGWKTAALPAIQTLVPQPLSFCTHHSEHSAFPSVTH
jgi:hypothetical protein